MKHILPSDKQFEEAWEDSQHQIVSNLEYTQFRQEAHLLLKRINRRRLWLRRVSITVSGIAAMLCLLFGGLHLWNSFNEQSISHLITSTGVGERKQVMLSDSTLVWLNACSSLRYPSCFVGKDRRVEMQGEVFFQVNRSEKHPFVVIAGQIQVHVLGTAFDVKAYDTDRLASVSVESGMVQVNMLDTIVRLKSAEQVRLNRGNGNVEKRNSMGKQGMWRSKGLRFDKTPLSDVGKELERIYGCRVYFERGGRFESLISGSHDNESLEAVLRSLRKAAGIEIRQEGNNIFFYKKKNR